MMVRKVSETLTGSGVAVEFVRTADLKLSPCDACWHCSGTGHCRVNDDMQAIYPRLMQADAVVIGSPVHMGHSVSGQAQIFLDRTFALWHQKRLTDKIGGAIAVSNRRGTMGAVKVINGTLLAHHIMVAGYATGYGLAPGDVSQDARALKEAEALGRRVYQLMTAMGR